jgi:environmental stress-induced protein Ves
MSTLIPFAGLATVPWKNGSGSTTEIAVDPPAAGFDDFNWRVSLATISESGPFSVFPGVERTLALVDGNGMILDIDTNDRVHVGQDEPVLAFSGDSEVEATLNRGPSVDFNVMTRSETCYHLFGRRRLTGNPSGFAPRGDVSVLFLAEGDSLSVSSDGERIGMVRFDTILFRKDTSIWRLEGDPGVVLIADIFFNSDDDGDDLE